MDKCKVYPMTFSMPRSANIFKKSHTVNMLGFADNTISFIMTQLCCFSTKQPQTSYKQCVRIKLFAKTGRGLNPAQHFLNGMFSSL